MTVPLLLGACLMLAEIQPPAPRDPDHAFAAHLATARRHPEHADFRALRLLFASTSFYDPAPADRFDPAAVEHELNNGERAAALIALDSALIGHWTDIAAHDYAIAACERAGLAARESLHRAFLDGLARSILDSGDGRTPQTAWHVISEAEEELLLYALGSRLESREPLDHDGHALRRLIARDTRGGETTVVYVNVDIPERWRAARGRSRKGTVSP
jgi:hypothetical protein